VRKVVEKLRHESRYADNFNLLVIAWDQPGVGVALDAGITPQVAIERGLPSPSECDLVVLVTWSRMGTPLPDEYRKPDGSRYASGTEYEFFDALASQRESGSPSVWIYRRTTVPAVPMDDPAYDEKRRQWEALEDFFEQLKEEDGALRGGINTYETPEEFETRYEQHLRAELERRLKALPFPGVLDQAPRTDRLRESEGPPEPEDFQGVNESRESEVRHGVEKFGELKERREPGRHHEIDISRESVKPFKSEQSCRAEESSTKEESCETGKLGGVGESHESELMSKPKRPLLAAPAALTALSMIAFAAWGTWHLWQRFFEPSWLPRMVALPGGTFRRGSEEGGSDELHVRDVAVDPFALSATEITVAQYARCVDAGECEEPDSGRSCNWGVDPARDDHPVNCVSWSDAGQFASFVSRWLPETRLPTEAEWEYAARDGGKDITYPWGDAEAICDRAVIDACKHDTTEPVCSAPRGSTSSGICDLAGNVWEWVADDWHVDYEGAPADGTAWVDVPRGAARVIRGGSFRDGPRDARAAYRYRGVPGGRFDFLGFRLSRSLPFEP